MLRSRKSTVLRPTPANPLNSSWKKKAFVILVPLRYRRMTVRNAQQQLSYSSPKNCSSVSWSRNEK